MTRSDQHEIIDKVTVHLNHLKANMDDKSMFELCVVDLHADLEDLIDDLKLGGHR